MKLLQVVTAIAFLCAYKAASANQDVPLTPKERQQYATGYAKCAAVHFAYALASKPDEGRASHTSSAKEMVKRAQMLSSEEYVRRIFDEKSQELAELAKKNNFKEFENEKYRCVTWDSLLYLRKPYDMK